MSGDFAGKVVLITGATGGIGRVACRMFGQAGARLALSDLSVDELRKLDGELGAGERLLHAADIGDSAQVGALFAAIDEKFGRLDIAFNNAGSTAYAKPLTEADDATWDSCLRVTLTGTFYCMREEVRRMVAQGGGTIVNNCSVLGLKAGQGDASAAYTAAKHGVAGLTKNAAVAYGPKGVRVNAVCPGLIEAGLGLRVLQRPAEQVQRLIEQHPLGRVGKAEEVVEAVLWLSSDKSSFVNGHLLSVDGGYGAR